MRLRSRILLIIVLAFTLLAGLLAAVNGALMVTRFHQLETVEVAEQFDRLHASLSSEADELGEKLSDWSSWDDLWRYLSGSNPTFVAQQITPSSLTGNAVELMFFLDPHGRVVHREALAGEGGAARGEQMARLIADTPVLRPVDGDGKTVVAGLLGLPDGLVIYSARPVLHSDGSGPASGTLVWIRDLNTARLAELAQRLHSSLEIWRRGDAPAATLALAISNTPGIRSDDLIAGAGLMNDALGHDTLVAQVTLPRRTWNAGLTTLWWQAGTTALALLFTALIGLWVFDHLITRRVLSLAAQTSAGDRDERRIHIAGGDELGELARQVDALRDRLRTLLREAVGVSEAKATFLATMSHEIRTPLNGVIGMVNLLSRTALEREQKEYTDIIKSSADALLLLLNDVLDFSKIEAGKLELEQVPFRLSTVLGDAAAVLAGRIHDKGVGLVLAFDPGLPERVVGDPGRLRQVISNLVSNAAKFTEHGTITVRANAVRDSDRLRLTITVEDTGIGMDAATCDRLFQAFTQAEAATSRKYGGTGLGLVICKRLVELMGGTIIVTSIPGRGSTFTLTIALTADGEDQPLAAPAIAGQRVLIASSRPGLRSWLQQVIRWWGGEAQAVGDGLTLGSALDNDAPGLVLLDRTLMGGGDDPCARIQRCWPGVPIVVLRLPDDPKAPPGTVAISHPVRLERLRAAIIDSLSGAVTLPEPTTAGGRPRFTGRVLVVDDHPINRRLAQALLTGMGLEVLEAVDGQQALDQLAHENLTLVLMDCQMPVLDGLEASRRWRTQEAAGTHLPIIALTANAFNDDRKRCLAAGMDDFLGKPLREDELAQVLARYCGGATDAHLSVPPPLATPPTDPPPSATPVIDERSRAMLEGMPGSVAGTTLFAELTARFRSEFGERFGALVADIISQQASEAARKAHALKGSSLTLGMAALGSAIAQVEHHTHNSDVAGALQHLSAVETEWQRVINELDRLQNSTP